MCCKYLQFTRFVKDQLTECVYDLHSIHRNGDEIDCWVWGSSILSDFSKHTMDKRLESEILIYDNYSLDGFFIEPEKLYGRFERFCKKYYKTVVFNFTAFDSAIKDLLYTKTVMLDNGSGKKTTHYEIISLNELKVRAGFRW